MRGRAISANYATSSPSRPPGVVLVPSEVNVRSVDPTSPLKIQKFKRLLLFLVLLGAFLGSVDASEGEGEEDVSEAGANQARECTDNRTYRAWSLEGYKDTADTSDKGTTSPHPPSHLLRRSARHCVLGKWDSARRFAA